MSKGTSISTELSTLRAVTFRLSSTPTSQLPQQVPAITTALANCKTLLSSVNASASQSSSEASVAIHKYRTFLSTLLQDRTIQGRWTAVVLIKATIEVGGWETLQKSLPWVRGLLGILSKPDPPTSKRLCLITLTRIFMLTREYPTLIREITTPSLSAYIQACLQLIASNPPSSLVEAIVQSFNQLLPRHPTVFRSYIKQLQQILGHIIAPTPSSILSKEQSQAPLVTPPFQIAEAARRLYVQLPCCAPKGASSDEWAKGIKEAVSRAHHVADKVFRAVVEDWQSTGVATPALNGRTLEDEVQDLDENSLSMPPWSGIYAGGERLAGLLRIIKEYISNPTPNVVTIPVGILMDLIARMLSLTVPAAGGSASFQNNVRFNNQVSKDERENLWNLLPQVHVETMELMGALIGRLEGNTTALDSVILDLLVWVFGCEKNSVHVRVACYSVVSDLLTRSGPALPKHSVDSLAALLRKCCEDVLPTGSTSPLAGKATSQGKGNGTKQLQASNNADAFLNAALNTRASTLEYSGLQRVASSLLQVLLSSIPAQYLSDSLRTRIDRTAILTKHKDAMVASVLYPPPSKKFGKPTASILPLLARSFANSRDVEALVRPRMPVLRTGTRENDMDIDSEEDEDEKLAGDEHFVGEELNSLLESASQPEERATTDETRMAVTSIPDNSMPATDNVSMVASTSTEVLVVVSPGKESNRSSNKRTNTIDAPPSPAKRMKIQDDQDPQTPATVQPSELAPPASVAIEATAQASTAAAPATSDAAFTDGKHESGNGGNDEEDEDDDYGELVLGQDTDEETDS